MMSPPRVHFLLKHLCLAQRRTRRRPEICAPFARIVRLRSVHMQTPKKPHHRALYHLKKAFVSSHVYFAFV